MGKKFLLRIPNVRITTPHGTHIKEMVPSTPQIWLTVSKIPPNNGCNIWFYIFFRLVVINGTAGELNVIHSIKSI